MCTLRGSNSATFVFASSGRVAQSVARLTQEQRSQVRYPVQPHTFVFSSTDSRGAIVSYWRKYEGLLKRLVGLSLLRKSVVRLTDRPDMTIDVDLGRKTNNSTTTTTIILPTFQWCELKQRIYSHRSELFT